ncbi:DUF3108 domain-containing protein [Ideonella sp.]|uniref:DUF3108 domain-containing protein n=1 Tax=Ideonella sp. TaxID=1929293 RepID=UPI0035AE9B3F
MARPLRIPTPPAFPAGDGASSRRWRLAGVVLMVLVGHAWLIAPRGQHAGVPPARPPVVQVLGLAVETAAPPAEPAVPALAPPAAADDTPAVAAPAPTKEPPPDAAPATEPLRAEDTLPEGPVDPFAGPRPPDVVSGLEPPPEDAPGPELPAPQTVASVSAATGGRPPLYTTQLPSEPVRVDYRLERGDDGGRGMLAFEPLEGGRYRARFVGIVRPADGGAERPLHDWESHGGFDPGGFAPERLVERVRGRGSKAINFQRDKGVITFSSSPRALALFPGAQDRVSLMLQLMAIAQGQPQPLSAGQSVRVQVAGTRGLATEWAFTVAGRPVIEPAGHAIPTVHLVREPEVPYDQRVEVWLAAEAGHLPVGLRLTTVPGRVSEAYWLHGRLPAPRPSR